MLRSDTPTLATARIASILSAGETCTPAPRAARKKRCRFSLMRLSRRRFDGKLLPRMSSHAARLLREVERADLVDEADELLAKRLGNSGNPAFHDAFLELLLGKADVKMQASALQRIAEIALAVGCQDHRRRHRGGNGPKLRDADLEVTEDLEQQRFKLRVRLVDFVDQQNASGGLLQCLQQRPRFDKFLGEEHVAKIVKLIQRRMERFRAAQHLAELVLEDLGVQELLGVFPLV